MRNILPCNSHEICLGREMMSYQRCGVWWHQHQLSHQENWYCFQDIIFLVSAQCWAFSIHVTRCDSNMWRRWRHYPPPLPPSMRNMSSWSRASATLGICGPVSTVNTMMLSNTSFRYVHVSTSSRFLEVNVTSSSRGGDKSSINQKSCITATALQMNLFK